MMRSAYASGTLSEPAIRTTAPTRSYPPANTGDQPWSETGARKRGSASSPPQNVAGAASEAISLGLGWVDDPLEQVHGAADRLPNLNQGLWPRMLLQNIGSVRCPPGEAL